MTGTAYPTKQGYFQVNATNLTATSFRFYVGTSSYANTYVNGGLVYKQDGTQLNVSTFTYDYTTGFAEVTTTTNHGLIAGDTAQISGMNITCS